MISGSISGMGVWFVYLTMTVRPTYGCICMSNRYIAWTVSYLQMDRDSEFKNGIDTALLDAGSCIEWMITFCVCGW